MFHLLNPKKKLLDTITSLKSETKLEEIKWAKIKRALLGKALNVNVFIIVNNLNNQLK